MPKAHGIRDIEALSHQHLALRRFYCKFIPVFVFPIPNCTLRVSSKRNGSGQKTFGWQILLWHTWFSYHFRVPSRTSAACREGLLSGYYLDPPSPSPCYCQTSMDIAPFQVPPVAASHVEIGCHRDARSSATGLRLLLTAINRYGCQQATKRAYVCLLILAQLGIVRDKASRFLSIIWRPRRILNISGNRSGIFMYMVSETLRKGVMCCVLIIPFIKYYLRF